MTFFNQSLSEPDNELAKLIQTLSTNAIFNGRQLNNIVVTSSADTVINHGLGRQPSGYIIVKKSAICDIYHTSLNTLTMSVRGSTSATISIWVY